MSGTQTALFGGGNRWITNPKHLPITRATDSLLYVKDGVGTSKASNNAAFYTAMALLGASGAITVADTFITLLNASGGGGFLYHVVAPTHSAAFTPTIEITVDGGTVYTIAPTSTFAAQSRLVLGATTPGAPVITTVGTYNENQIIQASSYNDIGFQGRIGGIHTLATGVVALPPEQVMMSFGMPMLRWEQSILIRVKASLLSAVAADKQCGAHYRLDL